MAAAAGGIGPSRRCWPWWCDDGGWRGVLALSLLLAGGCTTTPIEQTEVALAPPATAPTPAPDVTGSSVAPTQAVAPPTADPPTAAAPGLGTLEARRQLLGLQDRYPLLTSARELAFYLHDLDRDGQTEAFAVALDRRATAGMGQPWELSLDELGDFGRLHDPAVSPQPFALLAFGNRHGRLELEQATSLGWWLGIQAVATLPIHTDSPASGPLLVTVSFATPEGSVEQWRSFAESAAAGVGLEFRNTTDEAAFAADLDLDGVLEIVATRRLLMSDGTLETFMTRYDWTGARFQATETWGQVQRLRGLLDEIRRLWLARDATGLAEALLSAQDRRVAQADGLTDVQIIYRVFGFGRYFAADAARGVFDAVREVTVPDLVESPFPLGEVAPGGARISMRVGLGDGRSYVVDATLRLFDDPFGPHPYSFALGP
jgi:hypothetical protein